MIHHLRRNHACTQVRQRQQQHTQSIWQQHGSSSSNAPRAHARYRPAQQHKNSVVIVCAAAGSKVQPTMRSAMQGQVDPVYLAAASYLAEIGVANKTEIARVLDIAMNPNSLFVQASVNASARPLTVEADMKPVVDFLREQGLAAADVVRVITAHPPVLSYSVKERLQPFWTYLTSIGVPDVGAAVVNRPSLLGLSVDTSLRKIVDYLQYVETPPEKIVEYICKSI